VEHVPGRMGRQRCTPVGSNAVIYISLCLPMFKNKTEKQQPSPDSLEAVIRFDRTSTTKNLGASRASGGSKMSGTNSSPYISS
jgi:hypothetical protein